MASSVEGHHDQIESFPEDNRSANSPLLNRRPPPGNHGYPAPALQESAHHSSFGSRDFPYEPVHARDKTKVYGRRWYLLIVFSVMGAINGLIWNTWGPISNSASFVFNWSDAEIATFANLGNIVYCFTVFAGSWVMDVLGLRTASILCCVIMFLSAGLRCITAQGEIMRWLSNASALLNGAASTVNLAGPALFSSIWFPANQRATATAVINMYNYFGISSSFLIGPQIVKYMNQRNVTNHTLFYLSRYASSGNHSINPLEVETNEIMELMYIEAGAAGLVLLLILIYFPSRPPRPPSVSASTARVDFKVGLLELTRKPEFWLISLAYALPTGVIGIWCSVLNINLSPVNITQAEAGWLGFYYTLGGATSGLVVSMISDHFSRHIKSIIILLFFCASGTLTWVVLICEGYIAFSRTELYASIILSGVFVYGTVPLFYEMACELCYPVAEGVTGGYMTLLNNVVGVIFLFLFYVPNIGYSWLNWAMLASVAMGIPLLLLLKENYGKLQLDSNKPDLNIQNADEEFSGSYGTFQPAIQGNSLLARNPHLLGVSRGVSARGTRRNSPGECHVEEDGEPWLPPQP